MSWNTMFASARSSGREPTSSTTRTAGGRETASRRFSLDPPRNSCGAANALIVDLVGVLASLGRWRVCQPFHVGVRLGPVRGPAGGGSGRGGRAVDGGCDRL